MIKYIFIDEGHGNGCLNQSPDGRIIEWQYVRKVGKYLDEHLQKLKNCKVIHVADKTDDTKLSTRVNIANSYPASESLYISLHTDAIGDGKTWMPANGLGTWTCDNCSVTSKDFARCVRRAAIRLGVTVRDHHFYDYYVLKRTRCPAVLIELGFHTNKADVDSMYHYPNKYGYLIYQAILDLLSK